MVGWGEGGRTVDGGEVGGVGPEVEGVAFGGGLFVGEVEDVVAGRRSVKLG